MGNLAQCFHLDQLFSHLVPTALIQNSEPKFCAMFTILITFKKEFGGTINYP